MRAQGWITFLWPGLSSLWWGAEWAGLGTAVAFAFLLNFAMVATFIWPELSGQTLPILAWLAAGVLWTICFVRNLRRPPAWEVDDQRASRDDVDLFVQAQGEYLKGHWVEAETLLKRRLSNHALDPEARLLLATLYRRTRRISDARRELQRLERLETAAKWQTEIRGERERLATVANRQEPPSGSATAA